MIYIRFLVFFISFLAINTLFATETRLIEKMEKRQTIQKLAYSHFFCITEFCTDKEILNFSLGNKKLNSFKDELNAEILKPLFPNNPLIDLTSLIRSKRSMSTYVGKGRLLPLSNPITSLKIILERLRSDPEDHFLEDKIFLLSQEFFNQFQRKQILVEPLFPFGGTPLGAASKADDLVK